MDEINLLEWLLSKGANLGQIIDAYFLYKLIALSQGMKDSAEKLDKKSQLDVDDLKRGLRATSLKVTQIDDNLEEILRFLKRPRNVSRKRFHNPYFSDINDEEGEEDEEDYIE